MGGLSRYIINSNGGFFQKQSQGSFTSSVRMAVVVVPTFSSEGFSANTSMPWNYAIALCKR